jgi:hypothetical protein
MRIIIRFLPFMVFLLLGLDCFAASSGFNPLKDKTLLTIIGLFVLGWFVIGMSGEIRGSARSSEDKGWSLFVLFGVVAVILFLAYECS